MLATLVVTLERLGRLIPRRAKGAVITPRPFAIVVKLPVIGVNGAVKPVDRSVESVDFKQFESVPSLI